MNGLSLFTIEYTAELKNPAWTKTSDIVLLGAGLIGGGYKAVTNNVPTDGESNEFFRVKVEH